MYGASYTALCFCVGQPCSTVLFLAFTTKCVGVLLKTQSTNISQSTPSSCVVPMLVALKGPHMRGNIYQWSTRGLVDLIPNTKLCKVQQNTYN